MAHVRIQRFAEDCTIAREGPPAWPAVDHLYWLEAARDYFLSHESRLDAVATPVQRDTLRRPRPQPRERRREIDYREHTTWAEGAQEAGVGRGRIGQVVVDPTQEHGVAAVGGQTTVAGVRLHDRRVLKCGGGDRRANLLQALSVDLGRKYTPARPDFGRERD